MLGAMAFSKPVPLLAPVAVSPPPPPAMKPAFLQSLNIEIADFSPEWDFTTGGSKVLICITPSLGQYRPLMQAEALGCRFDATEVPATFVQGGVLKCYAPPHKVAFVQMSVVYMGEAVAATKTGSRQFEYRALRGEKKKRSKNGLSFLRQRPDTREQDEREYKIRAIECLCCMESKLHSPRGTGGMQEAHMERVTISGREYSMAELREMGDDQLELLGRAAFEKLVHGLFKRLRQRLGAEETVRIINEQDEHGCALLHYVTALDYYELIEVFAHYGAALDVMTKDNLTPLIISAAIGNKKTLSQLLSFGISGAEEQKTGSRRSPAVSPTRGRTANVDPLRVAIEHKHHGILEMLLRDMTLKDAIESNSSDEKFHCPSDIQRKIELGIMPKVNRFEDSLEPPEESSRGMLHPGANYAGRRVASEMPRVDKQRYGMDAEELSNFVLKIQRNVREWLLRRHYKDIKQASKALHSTLEKKLVKRNIDKRSAAIMIQRTVRAWLNIKGEISN